MWTSPNPVPLPFDAELEDQPFINFLKRPREKDVLDSKKLPARNLQKKDEPLLVGTARNLKACSKVGTYIQGEFVGLFVGRYITMFANVTYMDATILHSWSRRYFTSEPLTLKDDTKPHRKNTILMALAFSDHFVLLVIRDVIVSVYDSLVTYNNGARAAAIAFVLRALESFWGVTSEPARVLGETETVLPFVISFPDCRPKNCTSMRN